MRVRLFAVSGLISVGTFITAGLIFEVGSLWVAALLGVLLAAAMTLAAEAIMTPPLHDALRHIDLTRDDFAALATERDQMEAVLEDMDEGVLAIDDEERIQLLNQTGRKMLGVYLEDPQNTLADVLSQPIYTLIAPVLQRGPGDDLEIALPGLSPRILLCRTKPRAAGGSVVVMLDVTRLRKLEKVRQDFVANVSHELRTPISVIRANAETLLDGAIEDRAQAPIFMAAILRNAERLSALISDLLDIARIEAGQMRLSLSPVKILEPVAVAFESVYQLADRQQATITVNVPESLAVLAEPKALSQVLINLVENAMKYAAGEVEITAQSFEHHVRIEVRDNGPGIAPKHRARVFERFYRVDPGRSKQMGGTGLGLSIVKHLVAAMKGEVGVDPNTPTGSIFWVHLPLA